MSTNTILEVHADNSGNKVLYSSIHDWAHASHTAAIVLNYVLTGTEHYHLDRQTLNVSAQQYLVLNQGRSFDVSIGYSRSAVTGFAVYLNAALLVDVKRNLQLAESTLLENPFDGGETTFDFFEGVYANDALQSCLQGMEGALSQVKNNLNTPELYFRVAKGLLHAQGCLSKKALRIKAKSIGVKRELYRRVESAKQRLDESAENIKIADLAASVALSEFHFFRTFRQAFGVSPHRYQTQKKVEKAAVLLQQDGSPVSDIAYTLGFGDIQSFSKTFKHHYHLSPVQYRKKYSRI